MCFAPFTNENYRFTQPLPPTNNWANRNKYHLVSRLTLLESRWVSRPLPTSLRTSFIWPSIAIGFLNDVQWLQPSLWRDSRAQKGPIGHLRSQRYRRSHWRGYGPELSSRCRLIPYLCCIATNTKYEEYKWVLGATRGSHSEHEVLRLRVLTVHASAQPTSLSGSRRKRTAVECIDATQLWRHSLQRLHARRCDGAKVDSRAHSIELLSRPSFLLV